MFDKQWDIILSLDLKYYTLLIFHLSWEGSENEVGKNSIMVLAMIKKSQVPVRIILPGMAHVVLLYITCTCVYVIEVHSCDYSIAPYAQHCVICSAHNNIVQYTEGLYAILLHIFYYYSVLVHLDLVWMSRNPHTRRYKDLSPLSILWILAQYVSNCKLHCTVS